MKRTARYVFQTLLDLIFPRSCVYCRETVDETSPLRYLCRNCWQQIHIAKPPACTTCGYPFFGILAGPRKCPHCAELDPAFEQGKTLFLAKGPARALLHELKYHNGLYVLEDLSRIARSQEYFLRYLSGATLVPVPLHKDKLRERGYNQSLHLARILARVTPKAKILDCLVRTRFTRTQTRLDRSTRFQNMKNAFALAPRVYLNTNDIFILIDDVFTTGSTLNACAEALRQAGAKRIKVATIGHG
ncbi:MAG: ComF family protein [Coraliomargaritaceae bacterium]